MGATPHCCTTSLTHQRMIMMTMMVTSPVGPHGIDWRNKAGDELLTFLALRNMCLPMSFFEKKISRRATWYSPRSKRPYEMDHFMMRRQDLKRVMDAGTKRRHSVYSDHTAICLKVRIARRLKKAKRAQPGVVFTRPATRRGDTDQVYPSGGTAPTGPGLMTFGPQK